MSQKNALVIGTCVATSSDESGASLRLQSIKAMLEKSSFKVTIASSNNSMTLLSKKWDLIAVVSYSSARTLRTARKQTAFLWFDPTDSWTVSRSSLFLSGDLKQFFLLFRDLFWIWTAPRIDLLTFITRRDAEREKFWWQKKIRPLIIPILDLSRNVNRSDETRLVFMGDGNYWPNRKALKFLKKVLSQMDNQFTIHIYGKNFKSDDSRLKIHGYKNNSTIYFENDIHIAPIFYGAGLKLKVAIPLSNGIRVVTTREGANGLKQNSLLRIAGNPIEFARTIEWLSLRSKNGSEKLPPQLYKDDDSDKVIEVLSFL